jgi:hypothetical protein
MRELTKQEKAYIRYEVGGYELDWEMDGRKLNREQLVQMLYNDFISKDKSVDAFKLNDDVRFAGEKNIKAYITKQLNTCDPEMFE